MSIRQKVIGACDAALLVAVGVLQLGMWLAVVGSALERSPQQIAHSDEASHTANRRGG